MRCKALWMGGLIAALVGTSYVLSQPPGGGFQPGGPQERGPGSKGKFGSTDRNERFSQYSGGKEVWDRSQSTDPEQLQRFDRTAQMMGVAGTTISRQQYVDFFQQASERFGGAPGSVPGAAAVPGNSGGNPVPTSFPASSGGPPSFGNRGRGGAEGMSGMADSIFRRYDRDGDGVLKNEELPDQLRSERDRYDANRDGFIDPTEFRSYSEARMQQWQTERSSMAPNGNTPNGSSSGAGGYRMSPGGSASFDPSAMMLNMMRGGESGFDRGSFRPSDSDSSRSSSSPGGRSSSRQSEQPSRPVVYQPGNLPSSLPSWFSQRDTDRDGQIGLYEWRTSGESLTDFQRMDANSDGFVTVEEALRDQTGSNRTVAASGSRDGNGTSSGRFSGGGNGSSNGSGSGGFPWARGSSGSSDPRSKGGEGTDRERMMEMFMRGREAMMQAGGGTPEGMRGMMPPGSGGTPSDWMSRFSNGSSSERGFGRGRGRDSGNNGGPPFGGNNGSSGSSEEGFGKGRGRESGSSSPSSSPGDQRGPRGRRPGGD